jgi:hypothetical protein
LVAGGTGFDGGEEDPEDPGEGEDDEAPGLERVSLLAARASSAARVSPRARRATVRAAAPAKLSQDPDSKARVSPTGSFSFRTVKLSL